MPSSENQVARENKELAKENLALLSAIEEQVGAMNIASRNKELAQENFDLLSAIEEQIGGRKEDSRM